MAIPTPSALGDVNDGWRVALTTLMSERLSLGGGGTDIGLGTGTIIEHAAQRGSPSCRPTGRPWPGRTSAGRTSPRWASATPATGGSRAVQGPSCPVPRRAPASSPAPRPPRAWPTSRCGCSATTPCTPRGRRRPAPGRTRRRRCPGWPSPAAPTRSCATSLGERVLGLPAEPRADKGMSFTESIGRQAVNFDLSDEQRALAEAAAAFFTGSASPADSRDALDVGQADRPGTGGPGPHRLRRHHDPRVGRRWRRHAAGPRGRGRAGRPGAGRTLPHHRGPGRGAAGRPPGPAVHIGEWRHRVRRPGRHLAGHRRHDGRHVPGPARRTRWSAGPRR